MGINAFPGGEKGCVSFPKGQELQRILKRKKVRKAFYEPAPGTGPGVPGAPNPDFERVASRREFPNAVKRKTLPRPRGHKGPFHE
jgi:hypothetical protein